MALFWATLLQLGPGSRPMESHQCESHQSGRALGHTTHEPNWKQMSRQTDLLPMPSMSHQAFIILLLHELMCDERCHK